MRNSIIEMSMLLLQTTRLYMRVRMAVEYSEVQIMVTTGRM